MLAYALRRLLLIVPTLLGILALNFAIVQVAPGGPVETMIARLQGTGGDPTARVSGDRGGDVAQARGTPDSGAPTRYRGARGLDPRLIQELEKLYGFDQPAHVRFWKMLKSYAVFDFGQSFFRDRPVLALMIEKMPVSISLGLWSTLIIYLVSIPLGVAKAVRDGSPFDVWTSTAVIVGYAIPGFLFAILLIVVFAGGSYLAWFPLRGLVSANWNELSWPARILDYAWHMVLPVTALVIGGFASLTMLTKNSFLEELGKQYVVTAKAKGLARRRVLYGHVFRNAMLIVIAGFPAAFIGILFTGALLIEVIFSLDGLGLLGFEAAVNRDYPIMFGTLYLYTLVGLLLNVVSDLAYVAVDPGSTSRAAMGDARRRPGVESPGRVGGRRGASPRNTLRRNRLPPLARGHEIFVRLRRPAEDTVPGRGPPPPDPSRRRELMHGRRLSVHFSATRMIRESHTVIGRGTRWGLGGGSSEPFLPARLRHSGQSGNAARVTGTKSAVVGGPTPRPPPRPPPAARLSVRESGTLDVARSRAGGLRSSGRAGAGTGRCGSSWRCSGFRSVPR